MAKTPVDYWAKTALQPPATITPAVTTVTGKQGKHPSASPSSQAPK